MKDQIVKVITDYLNKMEVPKEKWDGTVGFFPAEWPLPTCTIADEIAEKLAATIAPHLEAGAGDIDDSQYTEDFLKWRKKYFAEAKPETKRFVSKSSSVYFGDTELESKYERAYNCKSKK